MWHMWDGSWPGWLFMGLLMLVFWGGVIALAVWAIRSLAGRGAPYEPLASRAMEILEERYARGEITREELEERRSVLRGKGS